VPALKIFRKKVQIAVDGIALCAYNAFIDGGVAAGDRVL